MAKKKDAKRRVDEIAGWLAEPMTRAELIEKVRESLGCSKRGAHRALVRVRRALKHRRVLPGDEATEQIERFRLIAREAREAGDFAGRIAAERAIMEIVGTKAADRVEVTMTPSQEALRALAAAAKRGGDG